MQGKRYSAALAVLAACAAYVPSAQAAVTLGSYNIAPDSISASGFSSGGFFAAQVVVALSATFKAGAGIAAGGPFYCVGTGGSGASSSTCATGTPDVNASVTATNNWSASGEIDNKSNLTNSKIYVFHGANDTTIAGSVTTATSDYFKQVVPAANVVYNNGATQANHGMVTDYYGNACNSQQAPYIVNCGVDLAGAILQHIYGPLTAKNTGTLSGQYVNFGQLEFLPSGSGSAGVAADGWAYVPQNCASGAQCKAHFVFHGCKQYASGAQGDTYYKNTGYNRWADTNNIIVVYPQTANSYSPYNYDGCWDYLGYTGANYAKKSGPQLQMVQAIADRLRNGSGNPPPGLPAPTGVNTSSATSSSMKIGWNAVTGAAGYNVYRGGNKVNAQLVDVTNFTDTGLASGTSYSWTVKAVDSNSAEGAASTAATGTTTGSPPPTATCYTASNYAHTTAGRAYTLFGYAYANGSNQNLGLWNTVTVTTLKKTGTNYYVIGTCP